MANSAPQRFINLPRYLGRSEFRAVSRAALEAIDADLRDVEMEYILEKLRLVGQQLLSVARTTRTNPPRDRLPRELEVVVNDLAGDPPTHVFAVFSNPITRVSVYPGHGLVLAAHCANIPLLPYSDPPPPAEVGSTLTLPVCTLCVPSPLTFPILFGYLYTKRREDLLASLLPMPPRDEMESSLEQLSQDFSATFSVNVLLLHATKVYGLWRNVSALGVFDEELWGGIETAWGVLVGALAISTGSNWRTEQTVNGSSQWYITVNLIL